MAELHLIVHKETLGNFSGEDAVRAERVLERIADVEKKEPNFKHLSLYAGHRLEDVHLHIPQGTDSVTLYGCKRGDYLAQVERDLSQLGLPVTYDKEGILE